MDTTRYEQLTAKRDGVGLTDEEADELGKMVAELEGNVYANADTLQAAEAAERKGAAEGPGPCGHVGCGCTTNATACSDFCRAHANEPHAPGPAFDCGCGHAECKAVVGEA